MRTLIVRAVLIVLCTAVMSLLASAQYGGGGTGGTGGGTTGGTTYSSSGKSYSSTGAIVGGVAGAAAATGLVLWMRSHSAVTGCVQSSGSGLSLMDESGKHTYALTTSDPDVKAGERVKIKGKKTKDAQGKLSLEVEKAKDLGPCK